MLTTGLLQYHKFSLLKRKISEEIEATFSGEDDAPLYPTPSFQATLQTTLVPEFGSGSLTPTFTRATTAYQTDFEGKLNLVPSGAARMQGARLVRNRVNSTLSTAWQVAASITRTNSQTDPWGSTTAIKAAFSVPGAGAPLNTSSVSVAVGDTIRISVYLKGEVGGERIVFYDANGMTAVVLVLTTDWVRYSNVGTASGTASYVYMYPDSGAPTIYAAGQQLEVTTGQTNQNPSETVSVGVLSAPYHGLGADGIKAFDTLNGNTVASNVVTEATGARIDSSQAAAAGGVTAGVVDASGPLGYLAEGARTNYILQSNTLGTTWTISNAADMNAVSADQYVSVDGATTMDKLQPKATTAVHSLDQAFTFTAAKYTFAADLRYVAATPQRWVALILNDGTTTWGASFDLLNGVAGAVSAGATSTIEATALTGVYRVSVTNTANAAAAAGTVKISLNATDTATLESAARAGTETLGAGMVQHEIGTFKSSRITTTTVAVTRNADVLTYPTAGNISGTNGTVYAEFTSANSATLVPILDTYNGAGEGIPLALEAPGANGGKLVLYDGTASNYFSTAFSFPITSVQKVATSWSGAVSNGAVNGVIGSVGSFDGNMNFPASFPIGYETGLVVSLNGTIRRVVLWTQQLASTLLISKTRTL